jgi:Glycosyl transferase family 11
MISFNLLGQRGRLGNQMFQYAALKGIADKHGYEFTIPNSNGANEWTDHLLFNAFELSSLKNVGSINTNLQLKENSFSFDDNILSNCPDDVDLIGYFQSEKYFEHVAGDLRKDFTFKQETRDWANKNIQQIKDMSSDKLLSLHIRRGDYVVQQSHHPLCSLEYYEKALSLMPKDVFGIIFSDDLDWAYEQDVFDKTRFFFPPKSNNNIQDLCLMSMCDYHVIANSSFSWWGAWLADSEKVIAPKEWFGPSYSGHGTEDLIPARWEQI